MVIEINTRVEVGPTYGKKIGNLTLFDAKFFGRPNFAGEMDRFKDDRRKFTVLIPNDVADGLRQQGWNVKTLIPTPEQVSEGMTELSHLKVMIDDGSQVYIKMGPEGQPEQLTVAMFGVIDRSRITEMDMEIRAWEYDAEERPGQYSARLVAIYCTIEHNALMAKYGRMGG